MDGNVHALLQNLVNLMEWQLQSAKWKPNRAIYALSSRSSVDQLGLAGCELHFQYGHRQDKQ